ncbi:MAG: hypothetical protein LQ339_007321 [Xanthoria mediterranea]|nr:MAG: hypothetical protein LQ339_007321 [Xanthoria mediterranea]
MSPSILTTFLFAIIGLTNASPLQPVARQEAIEALGLGFQFNDRTCGGEDRLSKSAHQPNSTDLNVQPDCDNVINAICNVVDTLRGEEEAQGAWYIQGNCEGHILVPALNPGTLFYQTCVAGFQDITINCMLDRQPSQRHGVANVDYIAAGARSPGEPPSSDSPERWAPQLNPKGYPPGYMMGPAGVFGNNTDWMGSKLTMCPDGKVRVALAYGGDPCATKAK